MPASLLQLLAARPGGVYDEPLGLPQACQYLAKEYALNQQDIDRRERHQRRDELYTDQGLTHIVNLIRSVFQDPESRRIREAWAPFARFNNCLKRIINEQSTVYQKPAARKVGGAANNKNYKKAQRALRLDERARQYNRRGNLHKTAFVMPRVRMLDPTDQAARSPTLDILSPAQFFLVEHPADATNYVAVGIKLQNRLAVPMETDPAWVVWSAAERLHLDAKGRYVEDSLTTNPFGRIPGTLLQLEPPIGGVWPGDSGESLVAGALAVWFTCVCLIKETQSATKIPVIQGDLAAAIRGQTLDSHRPGELPDGVSLTSADFGTDTSIFLASGAHIQDVTGANEGIAPVIMRHQGVQSAEARDMARIPLREIRLEQHEPLREFERELCETTAVVLEKDYPALAFDPTDFEIDFADPQTPRSMKELYEEFKQARELTLTSTVRFVRELNPDIDTDEKAWDFINANIGDEYQRNVAMRPLQAISGSPSADMPGASLPPNEERPGSPPKLKAMRGGNDPELRSAVRRALEMA